VDLLEHARATGRLLAVDECRRSGNVSEAIGTWAAEQSPRIAFSRVTAADSFIPLGEAAEYVLVQEAEIVSAALLLLQS
jgi:2-oxoisovalerate dehydrogenase E1 component